MKLLVLCLTTSIFFGCVSRPPLSDQAAVTTVFVNASPVLPYTTPADNQKVWNDHPVMDGVWGQSRVAWYQPPPQDEPMQGTFAQYRAEHILAEESLATAVMAERAQQAGYRWQEMYPGGYGYDYPGAVYGYPRYSAVSVGVGFHFGVGGGNHHHGAGNHGGQNRHR